MNKSKLAAVVLTGSLAIAGSVAAQGTLNLPHSRAGYWEVHITEPNGVVRTHHSCSRGETPKLNAGPYQKFCQVSFTRTPTGVIGDGKCAMRGITGTWHVNAQGDFVTHFTTDNVSVMKFPGRPAMTTHAHSEARWVGPCPPGITPGSGDQP
jgi:hypothetical protein